MFVKYKELLSKIISQDTHSSQIITQQSQTFTHLSLIVQSTKLEKIDSNKVSIRNLEDYVSLLHSNGFFQDLKNVDIKTVMEITLEQASEDLIWINDLHEADYSDIILKVLADSLH